MGVGLCHGEVNGDGRCRVTIFTHCLRPPLRSFRQVLIKFWSKAVALQLFAFTRSLKPLTLVSCGDPGSALNLVCTVAWGPIKITAWFKVTSLTFLYFKSVHAHTHNGIAVNRRLGGIVQQVATPGKRLCPQGGSFTSTTVTALFLLSSLAGLRSRGCVESSCMTSVSCT